VFIPITEGKVHVVNVLGDLVPEAGSIHVMDRGDLDLTRLYKLNQHYATFVIRAKRHSQLQRLYSQPIDKSTGLRCDQIIKLKCPPSLGPQCVNLERAWFLSSFTRCILLWVEALM